MSGTYLCPDCDGRVLHYCHPPGYFARRRLPRFPGLRRLRKVPMPEVEDVTLEEARHAGFHALADAVGEEALLRGGDT